MDEVNRTLYIPLYGKARVSQMGVILRDEKAEEIWAEAQFPLKGSAQSKWLTYFMAMRARVFDDWVTGQLSAWPEATVLHIGCGLDSRYFRIGSLAAQWYDVDLSSVAEERKKYYGESETYHILAGDASRPAWLASLPDDPQAIVVLEGVSMYLKNQEVAALFEALGGKFADLRILMDVYTDLGVKASKYKNPIRSVGISQVYGIDTPECVCGKGRVRFTREYSMTPQQLTAELPAFDRAIFSTLFTGRTAGKFYRLFAYETNKKPA